MKLQGFLIFSLALALPILAADPPPALSYDFRSWDASTIHDAGSAGIDLLIQRRPNDGALEGPAEPFPAAKEEAWRKAMNPNELSVAFWVRFDKLPSKGEPIGLVRCRADKDGFVTVTLPAHPTQFHGDYELRSKRAVRKGEWVHVEFNYSLMQRKAALYLDGHIQWENDNTNLPKLRLLPLEYTPQPGDTQTDALTLYEPDSLTVFDTIIPEYLGGVLYGAVCESVTSEQGARRTAMDAATKNAEEMIGSLSLKYNRARQGAITQEITEIVAGAET